MSDYMLHIMSPTRDDNIAAIVGDRKALSNLRDSINDALATGSGGSFLYQSDGEPYALSVALVADMSQVFTAYATENLPLRSARETRPIRHLPNFMDGYHKAKLVRESFQMNASSEEIRTSVMR